MKRIFLATLLQLSTEVYAVDDTTISNRLIGEIVDVLVDAVITIDPANKILFANRAAGRMFGYANDELVGMSLLQLIPARFRPIHQAGMDRYLASGGVRHGSDYVRVLGLRRDGRELPLSLSMTLSKGTNRTLITGVLRDLEELERARADLDEKVRELERLNAQLAAQAECDPMTGALNRRALQRLAVELWSADLRAQAGVAVAVCDIDFFKAYNDQYGHLGGDRCLIAVAEALKRVASAAGAHLVRFGGEEFVALFPGAPQGVCTRLASELRTAVESLGLAHAASGVSSHVTLSVGVAWAAPADVDCETLLRRADDALYLAKRYRNAAHVWGQSSADLHPSHR